MSAASDGTRVRLPDDVPSFEQEYTPQDLACRLAPPLTAPAVAGHWPTTGQVRAATIAETEAALADMDDGNEA